MIAALLPVTVFAASPSPSLTTSLDKVIAGPPTGYSELTTASLHGEFTAHDWAVNASGASPTETENTLNRFGFVDGYGKEWSSATARRALIEAVMAFNGGSGAKKALTALEATDKADTNYKHSDTITGIDPYYGAHFTSSGAFEDEFVFVKGNDLFLVIVAGAKDDVLTPATDQSRKQYDSAPADTIPSSKWPENASSGGGGGGLLGAGIAVGFLVVIAVLIAVFVMSRRRRTMTPAVAGMGGYAVAGGPAAGAPGAVQLSPDGKFWWDGQAWKDASVEAPPLAQRSSDGSLWWDGTNWHPIPQGSQAPPG